MSTGEVAGISVGVLAAVGVVGGGITALIMKKKSAVS